MFFGKKGVSAVVSVVILIALVLVVTAIVWTIVNNLVNEGTNKAESCYETFDKVTIERKYTCYNPGGTLNFSINVKDINLDRLLVSINFERETKSFEILDAAQGIDNLKNYDGSDLVSLPGKNEGKTYVYDYAGIDDTPKSIIVAPIINDNQCEISDSQNQIDEC